MKTRTYEGVQHGDWVRCVLCGAQMLLPCGADKCPECSSEGTLTWVDEDKQEMDAKHLDCLVPIRKLELQEYLSPEYDKEYYCGTCGAKDGAEHPKTGYCFHCDTDNWIPKND